jgi:predicted nucleic acid-binding protein
MDDELIAAWRRRFTIDSRTTVVNLGRRFKESRDPDDNLILATANAGRSIAIITNDRDLLELSPHARKALKFAIETPKSFLERRAAN